jgi:hypothetical protein
MGKPRSVGAFSFGLLLKSFDLGRFGSTSILEVRAKLNRQVGGGNIRFVLWEVGGFPQIWGLDNFLG